jgi:hypothetical protein
MERSTRRVDGRLCDKTKRLIPLRFFLPMGAKKIERDKNIQTLEEPWQINSIEA